MQSKHGGNAMKNKGTNTILNALAENRAEDAFIEGYNPDHTEALGMLLSVHLDYDGLDILKVAMYALEDANFHEECRQVNGMIDKINARIDKSTVNG